jgi:hypothetical protein
MRAAASAAKDVSTIGAPPIPPAAAPFFDFAGAFLAAVDLVLDAADFVVVFFTAAGLALASDFFGVFPDAGIIELPCLNWRQS